MEDKPAAVWEERERGRSGSWAEKAGFLVSPFAYCGPSTGGEEEGRDAYWASCMQEERGGLGGPFLASSRNGCFQGALPPLTPHPVLLDLHYQALERLLHD